MPLAALKQTVAVRMPWVLEALDLGANVLEIGPGYAATTDLLRGTVAQGMVTHLTCVEVDGGLAEDLRRRALGSHVTIPARRRHGGVPAGRGI
jgi:16S rRNA A1518/A1519 N6-dimethyltransferase RsmA/KsgA/DIM1 with predicted DNA glycosylase/AP lyase activity